MRLEPKGRDDTKSPIKGEKNQCMQGSSGGVRIMVRMQTVGPLCDSRCEALTDNGDQEEVWNRWNIER